MKLMVLTWNNKYRRTKVFAEYLHTKEAIIRPSIPLLDDYRKYPIIRFCSSILRYIYSTFQSYKIVKESKPDIIFVSFSFQALGICAWFLSKIMKLRYVLDCHTGTFIGKGETPVFRYINSILIRDSEALIVANNRLKSYVEKKYGSSLKKSKIFKLGELITDYDTKKYPVSKKINIAVISSFAKDEPTNEIINAAKYMDDITFYITGNNAKFPEYNKLKIKNIIFTGFLPYQKYLSLINSVDIVMCLTKRKYTTLAGAFESLSMKKPLITSNTETLKEDFYKGTIHATNDKSGIEKAITIAIKNRDKLANEILNLRVEKIVKLEKKFL